MKNEMTTPVREVVHGFKVFNFDWTCSPNGNTKQYACPGKFEEEELDVYGHGMHFCENAADCFDYYDFDSNNKVAEVIAYGTVLKEGNKSRTDKLEIVREIPWDEVLRIVNTGKDCTGIRNTGDRNTGDRNTGDWNTGSWNTGSCNTGSWNTGDWNKSSFNTGCFMTEEPKIMLFNKPSEWTYGQWLNSDAWYLLSQIPENVVEYIWSESMTNEEKVAHPEHETTGGYLKVLDESECGQIWWDGLAERDRDIIRTLPNFDAIIFGEITGIKVDE